VRCENSRIATCLRFRQGAGEIANVKEGLSPQHSSGIEHPKVLNARPAVYAVINHRVNILNIYTSYASVSQSERAAPPRPELETEALPHQKRFWLLQANQNATLLRPLFRHGGRKRRDKIVRRKVSNVRKNRVHTKRRGAGARRAPEDSLTCLGMAWGSHSGGSIWLTVFGIPGDIKEEAALPAGRERRPSYLSSLFFHHCCPLWFPEPDAGDRLMFSCRIPPV
jgi:hypothetical protein